MLPEDPPFRVIRVNSEDEILARATNLIIGRAAYETAVLLGPTQNGFLRYWSRSQRTVVLISASRSQGTLAM